MDGQRGGELAVATGGRAVPALLVCCGGLSVREQSGVNLGPWVGPGQSGRGRGERVRDICGTSVPQPGRSTVDLRWCDARPRVAALTGKGS